MKKNLLRKFVYLILFVLLAGCFIYISEKYKDNSKERIITINDYYKELDKETYEVIGGSKFISLIKKGKNVIIIGSNTSKWANEYVKYVNEVIEELDIDKVYYYDINNDKAQKNSNYYEIKNLLKGSLTSTDGSNSNLLAPSFYIIENNKVLYYNTETVAMKNTETPAEYWQEDVKNEFFTEITNALIKYYLNKE